MSFQSPMVSFVLAPCRLLKRERAIIEKYLAKQGKPSQLPQSE
jgi:hypothetical protein